MIFAGASIVSAPATRSRTNCCFGAYTCGAALPADAVGPAESVGGGVLKYDSATDTYSFQWKTDKAWKDTCQVFVVGLLDGTNLTVGFQFK